MSERPLPNPIAGHLNQVLPEGAGKPDRIRLTQKGEMVQKPGGRTLEFTAVQRIAVRSVEFEWRGAFGPNRLVRVTVVDRFRDGEGLLSAKVWGLVPAVRSTGADTDRAEAMRYLAELPWVPFAFDSNPVLSWRELEDGSVEVSTPIDGRIAGVQLSLDDAGLIRSASALRPRLAGGTAVETPWVATFGDYVELGGIRVPGSAEARWELPGGPFTYWRAELASFAAE
jgi:hypothetical protein